MILVHVFRQREIEAIMGDCAKQAPKAIMRALNRSVENARTNVVSSATEEYYVSATAVRKTITITKATEARLRVKVHSKDTGRELIDFKVSPKNPGLKRPPAVQRVGVKKGSGLKDLPGAFVRKGIKTGKPHVLKRTTSKRYPINVKYGISVPQMIGSKKVRLRIENEARAIFEKRLDHEISRILGGNK
ncbi:phage tail protein [Pelotomaculum propionicicum]|uniref:Prophage minor tail protein Z (GPZ) n=1 Tax=Pelotomaculum propionicicum TaxID=258475 RepID=A0A4Y7RYH6_9FIRM|nr:phage tail protein [Pelotomaculum propionicicum]TEB13367.1 hypothetical protein Pmgp_00261 [Pelotomaculum propionicicum]